MMPEVEELHPRDVEVALLRERDHLYQGNSVGSFRSGYEGTEQDHRRGIVSEFPYPNTRQWCRAEAYA